MKPEWKGISFPGTWNKGTISWCKGCGCLKIEHPGKRTRYLVPHRERERRLAKKELRNG
jgi:hypothetical protein